MIGIRVNEPRVEFITPRYLPNWKNMLQLIEECGRVSHRSEGRMKEGTAEPFIKKIAMTYGHESIIEHGFFTVCFVCDRSTSHQIVRHRIAAYTQESQRYCDYSDASRREGLGIVVDQDDAHIVIEDQGADTGEHNILNVIMPHSIAGRDVAEALAGKAILLQTYLAKTTPLICSGGRKEILRNHLLSIDLDPTKVEAVTHWVMGQLNAYVNYMEAREMFGIPAEDARSYLTNACRTLVYTTYDFREWRHFFKMRAESHAQWQIRILATRTLDFFKREAPVLATGYEVNPEWL
jgi:thymidylate synthase ThyX